jgi:hypothetical protein
MLRVSTRWYSDGTSVSALVEDISRNKWFSQIRISYVLRFISICDLFTDSPAYLIWTYERYEDIYKKIIFFKYISFHFHIWPSFRKQNITRRNAVHAFPAQISNSSIETKIYMKYLFGPPRPCPV